MNKPTQWHANASCKFIESSDLQPVDWIRLFGPSLQPRLDIGFLNQVRVDAGGHAVFTTLSDYQGTVGDRTWNAVMKYAEDLIGRNIKIAFFNSTPQGGGVALMRHALVRFLRLLGIDITWYDPISLTTSMVPEK